MYWKNAVRAWRGMKERYKFLGKRGTLLSWTVVYNAPVSFSGQEPYVVGLVEFAGGKRKMGQVVEAKAEELEFGVKVEGVLRKLYEDGDDGVIVYGTKYKLVKKEKRNGRKQ